MICRLCPRNCGEERTETRRGGVCGMPSVPVAARAMLHLWEEPCLVGERGAGCVFFSGCNLRCCFCQNKPISQGEVGKVLTAERLREIFHELIGQEAACLDLVTPTHFTDAVLEALGDEEWPVPVVWNCGGYEKPETLRRLEGKVQVYLPDLKYGLSEPARKYSGAADYFDWAKQAILEMFRQTGPYRMENGLLKQGVLIRHLLLPGELENTRRVIDWVAESFRPGEVLFSLMSQYTPQPGAEGKLARHVTKAEYRAAVEYMENCGITDGYTQKRTSAREEYTPALDLRGILVPAFRRGMDKFSGLCYVEKTRPRGRRDDPRQVEVAVDPAGGAGCAGGADGFGDPAGQRPQVRLSPGGPICRGGIS